MKLYYDDLVPWISLACIVAILWYYATQSWYRFVVELGAFMAVGAMIAVLVWLFDRGECFYDEN